MCCAYEYGLWRSISFLFIVVGWALGLSSYPLTCFILMTSVLPATMHGLISPFHLIFFRIKICCNTFSPGCVIAAVRINGMVERLQLSQQMRENVYSIYQQILNRRTSLFFNRHIDQIILCCFYGLAKVCCLELVRITGCCSSIFF